jgi:hypothetical protein
MTAQLAELTCAALTLSPEEKLSLAEQFMAVAVAETSPEHEAACQTGCNAVERTSYPEECSGYPAMKSSARWIACWDEGTRLSLGRSDGVGS